MENPNPTPERVPIIWDFGSISSKYATNLVVQSGENEMFLAFFELRPPLAFSEEDRYKIDSVTAECVGRIIVASDKMQSFIDAMQHNLDTYLKRQQGEEQNDGASETE